MALQSISTLRIKIGFLKKERETPSVNVKSCANPGKTVYFLVTIQRPRDAGFMPGVSLNFKCQDGYQEENTAQVSFSTETVPFP